MKNARVRMAAAWFAAAAWAAAPASAEEPVAQSALKAGGDLRVRREAFENLPGVSGATALQNSYLRIRGRLWTEYSPLENVKLTVRLNQEFRHYFEPDWDGADLPGDPPYEFPDETVIDNLKLDLTGLAGGNLDLCLGRQDLLYGNGRVIADGNAVDGSRTTYFNGVRAVWKGFEKTTVDVFGVSQPQVDDFAIDSEERNLTVYPGARDEVTESGGGVYVVNKSVAACTIEAYGIYKHEEAYDSRATTNATGYAAPPYAWQTLNEERGVIENSGLDLGTVGFRLVPVFNPALKGNLEGAAQFGSRGDRDVSAYMADASLAWTFAARETVKPTVQPGLLVMSGDDRGTADDEGWNPVWARYTAGADLISLLYPGFRWSNLVMPKVSLSTQLRPAIKSTITAAHLSAEEGSVTGDERGWYGASVTEFTLREGLLAKGARKDVLKGHLWLEVLEPGDYYTQDDTAYFARWEIAYLY